MNQSTNHLNNHLHNHLDSEPWYRQGWPWALIAIPILTVIAGVTTVIIAFDTTDSLVQDDYYKKGLAINSNLERLELAQSMALIANVEVDITSNLISIELTSSNDSSAIISKEIIINLFHPTLEAKDQKFTLNQLSYNVYIAEIINLEPAYWHIQIEDTTQTWLLKARWLYPDSTNISIDTNDSQN